MRRISLLIIFLLSLITTCSNDRHLPEGWRMPVTDELKDAWRNEGKDKFTIVKGDFNGDGIVDEANILVRQDNSGFAVFAFVSQKNHTFKTYLLDENKDKSMIRIMGIKKVPSNIYKTACGKGYWDCKQDEVSEINIRNEAIDYFKTESVNSFFYWDDRINNFKKIWISD